MNHAVMFAAALLLAMGLPGICSADPLVTKAGPASRPTSRPTSGPASRPAGDSGECCRWIDSFFQVPKKRRAPAFLKCVRKCREEDAGKKRPRGPSCIVPNPSPSRPVKLEVVSPDTLTLLESFYLEIDSISLSYSNDGPASESSYSEDDDLIQLDFKIGGSYWLQVEKSRYGLDLGASLGLGTDYMHITPGTEKEPSRSPSPLSGGRQDSLKLSVIPQAMADFRFYLFPGRNKLFVSAFANVRYELDYYYMDNDDTSSSETEYKDHLFQLNAGAGLGYGRVLNVGPSLKLKKLSQYLLQRGIIQQPLGRDVAHEILLGWYSLRNELGHFRRLQHAVEVLTRHGLLQKPLGLEGIYLISRLLRDWYLYYFRTQGWIIRANFDVSALLEDRGTNSNASAVDVQDSWLGVYLYFEYAKTLHIDGDLGLKGMLYFDPGLHDSPYPWVAMELTASYYHLLTTSTFDLMGALNFETTLNLSKAFTDQIGDDTSHFSRTTIGEPVPGSYSTHRLVMSLSSSVTYLYSANRASSFSVGMTGGVRIVPADPRDTLGYYLGLKAGVTFGMYDSTFSRY